MWTEVSGGEITRLRIAESSFRRRTRCQFLPPEKLDSLGIEMVKQQVGLETLLRILVSTESATVLEFYTSNDAPTEQSGAGE